MKYCQSNVKALNYNDLFAGKKITTLIYTTTQNLFSRLPGVPLLFYNFCDVTNVFFRLFGFPLSLPYFDDAARHQTTPYDRAFRRFKYFDGLYFDRFVYLANTRAAEDVLVSVGLFSGHRLCFFPSSKSRTSWPSYFFSEAV